MFTRRWFTDAILSSRSLQRAAPIVALLATAACREATPTSTAAAPRAPHAGGPSAAKGGQTTATPTGKGIGTLADVDVQRTRYRVEYHTPGRVMSSTSNVYLIWYGAWDVWGGDSAQTILTDFIIALGGSPYFRTTSLYRDQDGNAPSSGLIYGGSVTDLYSHGPTVSDQDIEQIVLRQLDSQGLPVDPRGIYAVLSTPDVWASSGWADRYCAFHDSTTRNGGILKLVYVGGPARSPSRCAPQLTSPNGNYAADAVASLLAAELANTVINPQLDGFYDKLGLEPADKCAWSYGTTYTTPNGAQANVRLGNRDYLLQQLWVPTKKGGYCALAAPSS